MHAHDSRTGIRLTGKTIGFRAWVRLYREAKVCSPKWRGNSPGHRSANRIS